MTSNAARLRELIAADEMPIFPGAYDGLSARLVQRAGFPGIYFSGGLSASSFPGVPDFGIRTLTEAVAQVGGAVRSTRMPIIADAEAGYGSVLAVQRLIWELENVGAAGMHMEDQDVPRRCGHYAEKRLVSAEEHAGRIAAAVDGRRDPDFVIIARTDAVSVSGFEDAVARSHAYVEAGADMVFFDGIETREQLEEAPKLFDVPVMANMVEGGKTPIPPAQELQDMGYALTIYSTVLYFTAMGAMRDALSTLKEATTSEPLWDTMGGFREWQEVTQVDEHLAIVDRFEPAEASDAPV
jgi:2-methylisocitrate lyase-like PEP mutase family enzyme